MKKLWTLFLGLFIMMNYSNAQDTLFIYKSGVVVSQRAVADIDSVTFSRYTFPTKGLVAWYPFNGNANDASGNANNGIVTGATLTTDRFGVANKAYAFNGTNNYITCPSGSTSTLNVIGDISYSYWIKTTQTSSGVILAFGDEVNANPGGYLGGIADGPSKIYGTSTCEIGNTWLKSSSTVNNGNWHNIVITLKSSTLSMYIDNVLNIQQTGVIPTSSWNSNRRIGSANYSLLALYEGILDDIAIYNRALTQSEITSLYYDK